MATLRFLLLSLAFCLSVILPFSTAAPHEKRTVARVGEPGLIGSGTYPRATFLKDGSMLACYTSWSGPNTVLAVARSTDGGHGWSSIGSISTEISATNDLDNCFLHQLPSGRILAGFRHHSKSGSDYTFYRLVVCYSDNNGARWQYLSTPATSSTPKLGIWEPFMMDALDGSLMFYFSRETKTDSSDQDNILIRSTNGGSSWSSEQTISGGGITCRDGMVGVARLGSGSRTLIAVFESLSPDTGVHSVESLDDGATWGNRRLVYKSSVGGASNAAPQVAYVGGKLAATFQTNEDDTNLQPNVKVVVSTDGGATWGQKTTALAKCNWAGAVTLDNTDLLVLCESWGAALAQKMSIV